MGSTLVKIVFFLKNGENFLKEHLEHLDFLRSWIFYTVLHSLDFLHSYTDPHKNYIIANTINFQKFFT